MYSTYKRQSTVFGYLYVAGCLECAFSALATTDLTVLRDKVLLPPPSFSHLFTLGDVLVDPEGVPVESLEPCSQSPLQCPDVVSQQLRLRITYTS